MKTWTVQVRLYVGFGLILSFLIIAAGIGLWNVNEINRRLDDIVDVNVNKINLLQTMSRSVLIVSRVVRTVALEDNSAITAAELPKIRAERSRYDEAFAKLQKFPPSAEAASIREQMKSSAAEARRINDEIINLITNDGDKGRIKKLIYDSIGPNARWLQAIDDNIDLQEKQDAKNREEASAAASSALRLLALTTLLGVVTSVGFAWLITRTLVKELGGEPAYASSIAKEIAAGNLAVPITVGCPDSLLDAMLKMRESLAGLIVQVRTGAEQIASASVQIAKGNQDLSARTESQASALEETASSMEELTSAVQHNADGAVRANELAEAASTVAQRGGAAVTQVVGTMGAIHESARKIVDIIAVIDGIAFQTNILALNAAVEAARAGEQGRGFAVVASEVRNLAQRSAAAAKEIKALISDSVEKVASGSVLADQAGATMEEVVSSVRRVTDIIGEITRASAEQKSGIEQVSTAIVQMDGVTQQNAALVEEAAAAAQAMMGQAAQLERLASVFKLEQSEHVHARRKRTPALSMIAA